MRPAVKDTGDTRGPKGSPEVFKRPPRGETHKPVSVSNDTHRRLMRLQMEMQYRKLQKVSFDDVIRELLDTLPEGPGAQGADDGSA